jgi:hypothetical protein
MAFALNPGTPAPVVPGTVRSRLRGSDVQGLTVRDSEVSEPSRFGLAREIECRVAK